MSAADNAKGGDVDGAASRTVGIEALPGASEEGWRKSSLGPVKSWDSTLVSFASLLTTFPHPAALFWTDDLILLCNNRWKDAADGEAVQGRPMKDQLPDEALSMLRTAILGRPRQSLVAEMFMNTRAHDGVSYEALLSPIMGRDDKVASGVMVQLLEMSRKQESKKSEQESTIQRIQETLSSNNGSKKGQKSILDELPLDENPFFQRFASLLPTGMAILNHKAEAVFVNEQFFELTSSGGQNFMAWPQSIHPEDYERVMEAYQQSFDSPGKTLRVEFRTIGQKDMWRLLMLSPLGEGCMSDESIEKYGGFVCAVIDITPNKQQELAQKRAAQEAMDRKEQQERFIDMISHEIRNPLSAVLHCAEEVLEIVEPRKENKKADFTGEDTSALLESAETIKLCVAHQKNIVDDILSFSKLDASMLSLCPRSVQPKRQLADSLKMFQPEMKKQHMKLEYTVDVSFEELNVDWVKADLVRVSQILVNLVTNAIKFTAKKDGNRMITCMIGASLERPTSYPPNVVFFDSEDLGFRMDGTNTSEWGNGQALYIMVAVKDTGIGISNENQKKLFQRFRQATPKTEESYGGSGLGLMIARKLCQLHGGEIGVSSIEGDGSTFGFFFRARRVDPQQGRPKKQDRLSSSDLIERLQDVTNGKAPIEKVEEDDVQENLKNPEVRDTDEAGQIAKGDEKFQHTAKIASQVRGARTGEYGLKSRPPFSTRASSQSVKSRPTTLEKMQQRTDSDSKKRSAQSVERGATSSQGQSRTHVLLVEDNVINQRILKRKLEAKKYTVTTANNGREAVECVQQIMYPQVVHEGQAQDARQHQPGPDDITTAIAGSSCTAIPLSPPLFDVILMDQEMPVLDGNAATKEIRELEEQGEVARVPILGLTANVREPQKEEMRRAGMDDVISKPYSMEDLVRKIDGLVGRSREWSMDGDGIGKRNEEREGDAGGGDPRGDGEGDAGRGASTLERLR